MIDVSHARNDHVYTDLLDRVAGGDYAAFAALYFDLYRPVQRYAQMLLTDAADAQNVAAAVFVEMWHTARLHTTFEEHSSERHGSERQTVLRWALTITRRRCLNRPRPAITVTGTATGTVTGTAADTQRMTHDKHLTCQLAVLLAAAGVRQTAACRCLEG